MSFWELGALSVVVVHVMGNVMKAWRLRLLNPTCPRDLQFL